MASKANRGEPTQDEAGGAFDKDLHETTKALWLAVILMCVGTAVVGAGVVALSIDVTTGIALLIAGAVIGLAGIALSVRQNIMSNVE